MAKRDSTPKVERGVKSHGMLNPAFVPKRRSAEWSAPTLLEGILQGDRSILGQAITLVESTLPAHRPLAQAIVEACLPQAGNSLRIGITGVPGVGKSSFIEKFGLHLIEQGHRVAVLAVDPSSQLSKGSILGDKTRMNELSIHPQAFIRPSPAGNALGGVNRKTRESIILCEAAGYDIILIETVGVGQSEVAVHAMTDFFLLLLLPGAGDELQGIKRGVVEMADLLAINKADGDNHAAAKRAAADYRNAIHLFPPKASNWVVPVTQCSALSGAGIADIASLIEQYKTHSQNIGYFAQRRQEQARDWLHESIRSLLAEQFFAKKGIQAALADREKAVLEGWQSPFFAAEGLVEEFGAEG
jgi:LAO/AO transport system kinase